MVLLKVSPWKGVIWLKKRGKLGPIYIGPYRVLAQVGRVAYRLDLSAEPSQIHITFHDSQLRKCLVDDSTVVPLEDIYVDDGLNYIETLVHNSKTKDLRNKRVELVKVQW